MSRTPPKPCVTTQAIVPDWDSDSDEDEEDDEEDEDGVRALGPSAHRSLSAPAQGSAQQRSTWPAGAHHAPAASCRSAATASRVTRHAALASQGTHLSLSRHDAHKARRALGREPHVSGDGGPVDLLHLAVQLAASTAAKLTAGARTRRPCASAHHPPPPLALGAQVPTSRVLQLRLTQPL